MQIFLMTIIALVIGAIAGSFITYLVIQKSQNQKITKEYHKKISNLEEIHQQELEKLVCEYTEKSDRLFLFTKLRVSYKESLVRSILD